MATGAAASLAFLNQKHGALGVVGGGLRVPALVTVDSFSFGCELSSHTCSFTFKVEEEDDVEHYVGFDHALPH